MEVLIFITALLLDLIFGEPPLKVHPVYWFGKIVQFFDKFDLGKLNFFWGFLCTTSCITFATILALIPFPVWEIYLLFSSISIKSMVDHVKRCLPDMKVEEVQKIVSRDVSKLNYPQRCSAVIESTSENFVDGFFSPLFYYSIFGIVGAMVYKAVNICDAMIGYRKGKYEKFGKFAARLDDVLNFIPARISLIFYEMMRRGSASFALKYNPKINGCSMAAMAYVLGVKLEKPGYYVIPGGREPELKDVEKTIKIFYKLCLISSVFCIILLMLKTYLIY
ncbi:MAG: adenosylcobinamide-phosphate synthase CbiB [Archaeoglobaceae archaeon]|nr:adenosylcobinamide-phosphate synthase CbiB [Archaeoglobaceae archaeon]MCX8152035.1 adenosylcobinamide-phosphate synthase CbiB [Archaeoglobaceae archaeon]MDW8013592.1 adenosylcobinamide-phosphate synthase CbiB [Archaeoglobaceae archaeon]